MNVTKWGCLMQYKILMKWLIYLYITVNICASITQILLVKCISQ